MNRYVPLLSVWVALTVLTDLRAQDSPAFPESVKEHQWLKQFVGQWHTESETTAELGQPPMKAKGRMSSRMLGEFWVISDLTGEWSDVTMTAIQTIGYDPEKKKYVGTWVDSMLNHLWRYEGSVDSSGKILTLEAEGPNFLAPGKTTKFRDAYEFKSKDHIVATSSMLTDDGKWVTFMTGHVRRVK